MAEKQTNYTISEGIVLPSKGLIYDEKVNPNIELRSMTARDEMKRLAPSATPFKTLSDIIEGCMLQTPAIHVYDLALGDYEYLLHRLRVVTYGDAYSMQLTCPHCGENVTIQTHLDDMEVKQLTEADWEALHQITLPKNGDKITLNIMTPRMLEETQAKAKQLKRRFKDAAIDFDTYADLLLLIEYVNGQKFSQLQLQNYIDRLPALDLQKLRNAKDKLNSCFGLKNEIEVDCPLCGGDFKAYFRFGSEFFRPSDI